MIIFSLCSFGYALAVQQNWGDCHLFLFVNSNIVNVVAQVVMFRHIDSPTSCGNAIEWFVNHSTLSISCFNATKKERPCPFCCNSLGAMFSFCPWFSFASDHTLTYLTYFLIIMSCNLHYLPESLTQIVMLGLGNFCVLLRAEGCLRGRISPVFCLFSVH